MYVVIHSVYFILNVCHCRSSSVMTLRGHSDSVNGVCFMPYSNSFVSCSADKSISQWDIRAVGLQVTMSDLAVGLQCFRSPCRFTVITGHRESLQSLQVTV